MKCKHIITASALFSLLTGALVIGLINKPNNSTKENINDNDNETNAPVSNENETNENETYKLEIYCKDCLVRKSGEEVYRTFFSQSLPGQELTFNFKKSANPKVVSLPEKISFKKNGVPVPESDYKYIQETGDLDFVLNADTLIEVNAYYGEAVSFTYLSPYADKTVKFNFSGGLDYVDWGDGVINSSTEHSFPKSTDERTIRIYGRNLSGFGFTDTQGQLSVESVHLYSPIKSILPYGFYNCPSLGELIVPDTLKTIGAHAFHGAGITEFTIPDSVTNAKEAFREDTSIHRIYFPENSKRTTIDDAMFLGCESLEKIELPDSVRTIGEGAFYGCYSLVDMRMPRDLVSISRWAFYGCKSLQRLNFIYTKAIVGLDSEVFSEDNDLSICVMADDYDEYYDSPSWESYQKYLVSMGDLHFDFTNPYSTQNLYVRITDSSLADIKLEYGYYNSDTSTYTWQDIDFSSSLSFTIKYYYFMAPYGITIRAKDYNEHLSLDYNRYLKFVSAVESKVKVSGFVNSLFYNSEIFGMDTMINAPCPDYSFFSMFSELDENYDDFDCSNLVFSSPTVGAYAYSETFSWSNNTTLLPIFYGPTVLSDYSCYMMFNKAGLVAATSLPFVQLAYNCCNQMFYSCSDLRIAPDLLCTQLAESCYNTMFGSCSSLKTPMKLPATVFPKNCYNALFYNTGIYEYVVTKKTADNIKFFVCTGDPDSYANLMFGSFTPDAGYTYYYSYE